MTSHSPSNQIRIEDLLIANQRQKTVQFPLTRIVNPVTGEPVSVTLRVPTIADLGNALSGFSSDLDESTASQFKFTTQTLPRLVADCMIDPALTTLKLQAAVDDTPGAYVSPLDVLCNMFEVDEIVDMGLHLLTMANISPSGFRDVVEDAKN